MNIVTCKQSKVQVSTSDCWMKFVFVNTVDGMYGLFVS